MAFESLSEKLQNIAKSLRGKGKVTEKDLKAAVREIRMALLEADVNYKVVREFIKNVQEKALGSEILESLTPGQQIIKVVNEELTALMGGGESKLQLSGSPAVILMAGLQGSGKTTTSAKLARVLKKQGRRPLLVPCDVYRPAAEEQLRYLGESIGVPVYDSVGGKDPRRIAADSLKHAGIHGNDVVIVDTAGRLHIDDDLMAEIADLKELVNPSEILLVVDSMTGQEAVTIAESFNSLLEITGVVLTKTDGDTRGGAALSVKAVTGKPIKFIGTGEKTDGLEIFHPDRMASRILGMGDVLSLIEKAQENIDAQKAVEMEKKLRKAEFSYEDFLEQMGMMQNMGSMDQLMGMIPGASKQMKGVSIDEKEFVRVKAIIQSMTTEERRGQVPLNGNRRKRIAAGSGTRVQDINRLVKQFEQAKKMMKQLAGMSSKKKSKGFKLPF